MRPSRRRRGILAAVGSAAVVAATLSVVAVNAYADEPFVDLSVAVPSAVTSADTASKDLRVEVVNNGNAAATGVTITVTLPKASDAGTVTLNDDFAGDCELSANGRKATCAVPDVPASGIASLRALTVHPAELGDDAERRIGRVKLVVSSTQADLDPADNEATVVARVGKKPSVDLVVWPKADIAARPGGTGVVDGGIFTVSNESNVPLNGVEFMVVLPTEAQFTFAPEGCSTNGSLQNPDSNPSFQIRCFWPDVTIGAGEEWSPSGDRALPFEMSASAPAGVKLQNAAVFAWEYTPVEEEADTLTIDSSRTEAVKADDRVLEPGPVAQDNLAEINVFTVEDRADLFVTSVDVGGWIADRIPVTVTAGNAGPAAAAGGYALIIAFPEHVTIIEAPDSCISGDEHNKLFTCVDTADLAVGAETDFTFNVELAEAHEFQEPAIAGISALGAPDPDKSNNSVEFAITVTEETKPTDPPTEEPTTGEPTSGEPTGPSTSPSDDGPGGLPITGTSLTMLIGGALLLVVVGVALLIASRRRRAG
ncbi:hypothetical protein [Stackebrandtia soli]|uniref:hypothetical protein n=1 Tax=Stackebrandtia soli TaxID=1892856 RepID=UPI0039EBB6AB